MGTICKSITLTEIVILSFFIAQLVVRTAILWHGNSHTQTYTHSFTHTHMLTIIAHMCVFSFGERVFEYILYACLFFSFSFSFSFPFSFSILFVVTLV